MALDFKLGQSLLLKTAAIGCLVANYGRLQLDRAGSDEQHPGTYSST
jgi:hypothetical protein